MYKPLPSGCRSLPNISIRLSSVCLVSKSRCKSSIQCLVNSLPVNSIILVISWYNYFFCVFNFFLPLPFSYRPHFLAVLLYFLSCFLASTSAPPLSPDPTSCLCIFFFPGLSPFSVSLHVACLCPIICPITCLLLLLAQVFISLPALLSHLLRPLPFHLTRCTPVTSSPPTSALWVRYNTRDREVASSIPAHGGLSVRGIASSAPMVLPP